MVVAAITSGTSMISGLELPEFGEVLLFAKDVLCSGCAAEEKMVCRLGDENTHIRDTSDGEWGSAPMLRSDESD